MALMQSSSGGENIDVPANEEGTGKPPQDGDTGAVAMVVRDEARETLDENPWRLLNQALQKIHGEFLRANLTEDVSILEKIKGRLEKYRQCFVQHAQKFSEDTGRSPTAHDVLQNSGSPVRDGILVTYKLNDDGGCTVWPDGNLRWFDEAGKKPAESEEYEIIDYCFSALGLEIFLKNFGISGKEDDFENFRKSAMSKSEFHPSRNGQGTSVSFELPSNVSDISVAYADHRKSMGYDRTSNLPIDRQDKVILSLIFGEGLLERLLPVS